MRNIIKEVFFFPQFVVVVLCLSILFCDCLEPRQNLLMPTYVCMWVCYVVLIRRSEWNKIKCLCSAENCRIWKLRRALRKEKVGDGKWREPLLYDVTRQFQNSVLLQVFLFWTCSYICSNSCTYLQIMYRLPLRSKHLSSSTINSSVGKAFNM